MNSSPWIAENIIVTLDFDGCIAIGDFLKIKYSKILYNVNINQEQCSKEKYPLGQKKYLELMDIVASDYILEYKIDPQCKQILISLYNQGFRFAIVTSREKQLLEACKKFVKYHGLPISYIYGAGKRGMNYISKDFLIKKLKSRAMIDDTLYKLAELKYSPVQLFFLIRPWSEHELKTINLELNKRINIIKDWREFYQGLIFMKELHEAICYYQNWKNDWTNIKNIFNFWLSNPKLCFDYLKNYRLEMDV